MFSLNRTITIWNLKDALSKKFNTSQCNSLKIYSKKMQNTTSVALILLLFFYRLVLVNLEKYKI